LYSSPTTASFFFLAVLGLFAFSASFAAGYWAAVIVVAVLVVVGAEASGDAPANIAFIIAACPLSTGALGAAALTGAFLTTGATF